MGAEIRQNWSPTTKQIENPNPTTIKSKQSVRGGAELRDPFISFGAEGAAHRHAEQAHECRRSSRIQQKPQQQGESPTAIGGPNGLARSTNSMAAKSSCRALTTDGGPEPDFRFCSRCFCRRRDMLETNSTTATPIAPSRRPDT